MSIKALSGARESRGARLSSSLLALTKSQLMWSCSMQHVAVVAVSGTQATCGNSLNISRYVISPRSSAFAITIPSVTLQEYYHVVSIMGAAFPQSHSAYDFVL